MSKEYRYNKVIRSGQYFIPVFYGLSIFMIVGILLAPTAVFHLDSNSGFPFMAPIILIVIIIYLCFGTGTWYMYYRLAGVSVSIDNSGVVYKYRGGVKHLLFENIKVESASIKYTGGWLKLVAGKDMLRLTVTIEGIGTFIQELKSALDSRGLSDRYDPQSLFGFMKTAAASDQSWERFRVLFGKLYLSIFAVCITLVNGFIFGTIRWGILFVIIWSMFTLLWATGAYMIAEIVLMRKIAKESDAQNFTFPKRDLALEKLVFDKAINWGGWLYFGISLLVMVAGLALKLYIMMH